MTAPLPSQARRALPFPRLHVVGDEAPPAQADLSERVVLSACLSDGSLVAGFDWLLPEHFRLGEHRHVWAALRAVHEASGSLPAVPCTVDVARALDRAGQLVAVGGVAALIQIISQAPDVADLQSHAEGIYAAHQQRAIGAWADSLSATARTTRTTPQALLEGATSALASLQAQQRVGQPPGVLLGDAAASFVDELDSPTPLAPRLSTGLRTLDALSGGGMGRGALWVLGGRPGMGKTALAQAIALNVAWADESAAMFSLEMSRAELSARALASESGVPALGVSPGADERAALREAAGRIRRLPLWIDDTPGLQLDELLRRARALAARARSKGRRLALVVVDYLQLVRVPHIPGRKRSDEIAEVSSSLKALARELDCAVLALAQLNRESEREARRPRMTDLRDCGQIEQDADWIGILWRKSDTPDWMADLALCKQRTGARTADTRLRWQAEITRFDDV